MLNAIKCVDKKLSDVRIVVNGAGAAALSVSQLLMKAGVQDIVICDTKGVIYKGRTEGMNRYKAEFAVDTKLRTLSEAFKGADCFIGLSVAGAVTPEMIKEMAPRPLIFAMANPDPEITPEEVASVRRDAIVATGASIIDMDFLEALGFKHYQAKEIPDDNTLRSLYIDRIYDTYIDEEELQACDHTILEIRKIGTAHPFSRGKQRYRFQYIGFSNPIRTCQHHEIR